jgi:hypothetical protein
MAPGPANVIPHGDRQWDEQDDLGRWPGVLGGWAVTIASLAAVLADERGAHEDGGVDAACKGA